MAYDLTKTFTDTEREILQKFRGVMSALKDAHELRQDLSEFFGGRFSGNVSSIAAHFNALEGRSDVTSGWIAEMNSDTWIADQVYKIAIGETTLTTSTNIFDSLRHWT